MLRSLSIQNIILIENAELSFGKGLNVLSGETGSGKSAIMHALTLIAGDRADASLIRHGSEKGIVEGLFDLEAYPEIITLLQNSGIDHELGQDLIIKREIYVSGKSRAFVNRQLVQTGLLKKIGEELFQIVNQHANQKLFSIDHHRHILDLYGKHLSEIETFQTSYRQELAIQHELDDLIQSESQRCRDIDRIQAELEELETANFREGEDEQLFEEFSRLSHSEEIISKLQEIQQALSVLPHLNRLKSNFEHVSQFDPELSETSQLYKSTLLELQEIQHTLQLYLNRTFFDPERLSEIENRLSLINKLKRKYGQRLIDIQLYITENKHKLEQLHRADQRIHDLQESLRQAKELSQQAAVALTKKREAIGKKLEKSITSELVSLNMPHAQCVISITPQKRTLNGDDRVEFLLIPNKGEQSVSLKEGASGGEISRLLLSLHTLLAGKDRTPVLIFDEVDANIGGATGAIVGTKLKKISELHQVLCITHFPQVASQADHHLQISKEEIQGRTFSRIRQLDNESRRQELARMVGYATTELPI